MANKTCNAAVFNEVGKPLEIRTFKLPRAIEPGAALCRVRMSTICGSDLHTVSGRRRESAPLILGHEAIGEIAALGDGLKSDGFGHALQVGDRVTWSVMASCGSCFYCSRNVPQKCERLRKYGHTCCLEPPGLMGGFGEYIYLFPGTAIFKIPNAISDEAATPANCALSTVMNAAETIGIEKGDAVLIQGAGLLGLNLIALAAEAGARKILVTDINPHRLDLASRFGAEYCLNPDASNREDLRARILDQTGGRGVDAAFEVCGSKDAAGRAVEALRIGGRYLLAGLVTPGSDLGIDGNQVTRKILTIKGIHNYRFDHLGKALGFLEKHHRKYPYAELVSRTYPLKEINEAFDAAASGKHVRVGVR
jgi:alcohol dehydrogenase